MRWWIPARSRRSLIPRRRLPCGRSVETVRTGPYFNVGDIWSGRPATGVHPKGMRERLGHANIGITLDAYGHVVAGCTMTPPSESRLCSARLAIR